MDEQTVVGYIYGFEYPSVKTVHIVKSEYVQGPSGATVERIKVFALNKLIEFLQANQNIKELTLDVHRKDLKDKTEIDYYAEFGFTLAPSN